MSQDSTGPQHQIGKSQRIAGAFALDFGTLTAKNAGLSFDLRCVVAGGFAGIKCRIVLQTRESVQRHESCP